VLAAVIAVAAVAWGDHDGGSAELCSSPEILEVRVGDTSASDASDLPFAVGLTGTFDEQTKGPRHRLQLCEKKAAFCAVRCTAVRLPRFTPLRVSGFSCPTGLRERSRQPLCRTTSRVSRNLRISLQKARECLTRNGLTEQFGPYGDDLTLGPVVQAEQPDPSRSPLDRTTGGRARARGRLRLSGLAVGSSSLHGSSQALRTTSLEGASAIATVAPGQAAPSTRTFAALAM
jgi:hypothetical protein